MGIIFTWPVAIFSLFIAAIAIGWRRPAILLAAAMIAAPFLFYFAATPRFQLMAPAVGLLYFLAPLPLRREHCPGAILLVIPFAVFVAVVVFLVVSN